MSYLSSNGSNSSRRFGSYERFGQDTSSLTQQRDALQAELNSLSTDDPASATMAVNLQNQINTLNSAISAANSSSSGPSLTDISNILGPLATWGSKITSVVTGSPTPMAPAGSVTQTSALSSTTLLIAGATILAIMMLVMMTKS